ncbi:MAG: murein biosynthesis integral membrane protein MurJ, partial [Epsilonproteobacteria bacterium]|nr:murein biosynthesis integral membrane protein MurJ [Campylobacterota bacterium]NPA88959.1 murein biosynthesis integral membrane protein MurJ [Campylobacterota bacterium]
MIKGFLTNFFGIFSSRILGFIRDLLTASILGANIYSDIFFIAFKFPNLFRRIFAEGAFTQAFLPTFANSSAKPKLAFKVLLTLGGAILLLTLLVMIFRREVAEILAIGLPEEWREKTAPLVAINFWYLELIFLVTFFATLLQYKNHFFVSAFSPALLNIALISALLISRNLPPSQIVYYLSFGVILGGIAQLIAHLIVAYRLKILKLLCIGAKSRKKVELTPFFRHFFPAVWGNSTAQLSAFVDTWLATFLGAGGVSYLYYANRLFQLPFALFVIALSTALFPKITRALNGGNREEGERILVESFWLLFALLLFATSIGTIDALPIVKLLFQRGAFTSTDSQTTATLVFFYLLGLIPFGLAKLFTSYLYATHHSKLVAKISTYSLLANLFFSIALVTPLGLAGLPLATTLGGVILFCASFHFLPSHLKRKILLYKKGWLWIGVALSGGIATAL